MIRRTSIAMLAVTALLALAACVMARPAPAHVGAPPADLGARSVAIASASGSTLAAWLIDGRAGCGAVLLLHGIGDNRTAMLPRARFLQRAGYAVLVPDLQAHGESPGDRITFGARESLDAAASLAFLRGAVPAERVGVIGISLGGAALLVGGEPPRADAVVLESVYPTIEQAVEHRFAVWFGPLADLGALMSRFALALTAPRLGISLASLRPIDRVASLSAPLLVIAGSDDRYTPADETRALVGHAPAGAELWLVEGAGHDDLHAFAPARYEARVGEFLASRLRAPSCSARISRRTLR